MLKIYTVAIWHKCYYSIMSFNDLNKTLDEYMGSKGIPTSRGTTRHQLEVRRSITKTYSNKYTVPCKYYEKNSYCYKEQHCPYLHGKNDKRLPQNVAKDRYERYMTKLDTEHSQYIQKKDKNLTKMDKLKLDDDDLVEVEKPKINLMTTDELLGLTETNIQTTSQPIEFYCRYILGQIDNFNNCGYFISNLIHLYAKKELTDNYFMNSLISHSQTIQKLAIEYFQTSLPTTFQYMTIELQQFLNIFEAKGGEMYELFKYYQTLN